MKQELLAPAGDIEAGYAALYYGADAVYLGLQQFSARATATNFDENSLNEFTAYAHHLGRKVYAAVNTVVQERELPELLATLNTCVNCRIDAVILQDLGVARVIHESYPELEMHASTQMAVHNKEGAMFLKSLGFTRVVIARELSLPEIKEIAAIEGLETEAFIHGALCYSYSGLCQFSSLEAGRSANRGKCLYPCRSCFSGKGGKNHIFSMKDMALQQDVLKMPVTSLKIEGRKKSALYVAAVTSYYRNILDGKGADALSEEHIKQIFSRPWCKFHFNGKSKDVTDVNFVGHRGLLIGKVEKVKKGWLGFTSNHKIGRFDGLQIDVAGDEKPFGFSVQNIKVAGKKVLNAAAGSYIEVELPPDYPFLSAGQDIYLASSSEVKGSYPYTKPKPHEFCNTAAVDVNVVVTPRKVIAKCGVKVAEISGEFTPANNAEKAKSAFIDSFNKTGGTALSLRSLQIENKQNLFVPVSEINKLRRDLYAQVEIISKNGVLPPVSAPVKNTAAEWVIKTDNAACLSELDLDKFAEIIYLLKSDTSLAEIESLPQQKLRLALPTVCRRPHIFAELIKNLLAVGYKKWEVGNYWALDMLPLQEVDLSFDTPLYMLNSEAMEEAKSIGAEKVSFAIEDTLENIKNLTEVAPLKTTFVVYQDVPLFTSAVCIRENDCRICSRKEKWYDLSRDGKKYQALSKDCQIMLFDKNPFCFAAEAKEVKCSYYRADFCYKPYSSEQVAEVMAKLMNFTDVDNAAKGNINNQKI
jgi:U32 family peptidase